MAGTFFTAAILEGSPLWLVIPVVGAGVPIFLATLHDRKRTEALRERREHEILASGDRAEREVLEALGNVDELTPVGVATRTSLAVTQASEVLDRLANRGHLVMIVRESALAYSLRESDRGALGPPERTAVEGKTLEATESVETSVESPEEPLSRGEL